MTIFHGPSILPYIIVIDKLFLYIMKWHRLGVFMPLWALALVLPINGVKSTQLFYCNMFQKCSPSSDSILPRHTKYSMWGVYTFCLSICLSVQSFVRCSSDLLMEFTSVLHLNFSNGDITTSIHILVMVPWRGCFHPNCYNPRVQALVVGLEIKIWDSLKNVLYCFSFYTKPFIRHGSTINVPYNVDFCVVRWRSVTYISQSWFCLRLFDGWISYLG